MAVRLWHAFFGHTPLKATATDHAGYTIIDMACECGYHFNNWGMVTTHYTREEMKAGLGGYNMEGVDHEHRWTNVCDETTGIAGMKTICVDCREPKPVVHRFDGWAYDSYCVQCRKSEHDPIHRVPPPPNHSHPMRDGCPLDCPGNPYY